MRTNFNIPDSINFSPETNYTQIPNEMLRNPELSCKAKTVLCLLLSNKNGWHSSVESLKKMMKEGADSIRFGISELEEQGYLKVVRYRDKITKREKGSLWAYSNKPETFDSTQCNLLLNSYGCEISNSGIKKAQSGKAQSGKAQSGKAQSGKAQSGYNIIYKKTKEKILSEKNYSSSPENRGAEEEKEINTELFQKDKKITISLFEVFWKSYPRKTEKGKTFSIWSDLCSKKDRPTWKEIRTALHLQKKTEKWAEPKFIPYPTTWLNQSRWLDDPEQMKVFKKESLVKDQPKTAFRNKTDQYANLKVEKMPAWNAKWEDTNTDASGNCFSDADSGF
jgi:hypothetical protein